LVLDGELFNDSLRQDLGSIISLISKKKLTENDIKKSAEVVEYHVYDIVDTDQTYYERHDRLKELIATLNHPQIKFVERIPVGTVDQIDELLSKFELEGHEGLIVRVNEAYENKRSKNLLKHKSFTDDEFLIVDVEEGSGNLSGKIGAFVLEDSRGVRFNSSPTGSHDYWEELWKNKEKLIGKYATVKYKELTPLTERGGNVPSFGKVTDIAGINSEMLCVRDYES
jgi:ATP-dependent DNA ligase